MHRIRTALVAGSLAFLAVAAQATIDNTVHRNFNVGEGGTLIIEADLGDINVHTGGSGVSVDVVRRARTNRQATANDFFRDYELTFTQEGNNVRIRGKYDRPNKWFNLFGD